MTKQFQLAAFGAPSGATYFVNVLLGLGFHVYNVPFGPWFDRKTRSIIRNSSQIKRTIAVPYFLEDPIRLPSRDIDLAWSHQWSTPCYAGTRTIVGIRDPRQALFSQWRRATKLKQISGDYRSFLASPYYYLGLSPIDEWVLWHALWLNRPFADKFVLRFELAKSEPIAAFRPLLAWMGESASDEAILEAAAASSVERARAADPAGRIVVKGALHDFDVNGRADTDAVFARTAVPMFETLDVPADMKELPRAVESLAARFDGEGAQSLIALASTGLFTDLDSELAKLPSMAPFERKLRTAIEIVKSLFTTPIFPHLNLQDPELRPAAAAVIGTLARSSTPTLDFKVAQRQPILRQYLSAVGRVFGGR